MAEFSKNPEMFQHLEGNIGLYMGINSMLKRLKYQNLFYSDLIHPSKYKSVYFQNIIIITQIV